MADIRPFRGVRYDPARVGGLQEVVGPPEDIPSNEEAESIVAGRPYHAVRLEIRDPDQDGHFSRAARLFCEWLDRGVLVRCPIPAFFVHEHEFRFAGERRRRRGLFAALRLADYAEGIVLPHENTLPHNVELRTQLLRDVRANLSAVYTLVQDRGRLEAAFDRVVSAPPEVDDNDSLGGHHRIWVVTDPTCVRDLRDAVARHPLYIADGHHRYAAALHYRAELRAAGLDPGLADWVLAYIADVHDPGILVLPIHRVVRSLGTLSWDDVRACLDRYLNSEEQSLPADAAEADAVMLSALGDLAHHTGPPTFLVVPPGGRSLLRYELRDWAAVERLIPVDTGRIAAGLDVSVLDALLLRQILGFDDDAIEAQVDFTPDAPAAFQSIRAGAAAMAVFLRPTPFSALLSVARAGGRMPQKSTYFYPKIPIGLLMRDLHDVSEAETG